MPETLIAKPVLFPVALDLLPTKVLEEGRYEVRFAQSLDELDEVLRLRFEIFNLELNEGLEESFADGRDRDEFDAYCHHLIVSDRQSGAIVGTYRMQTSTMAQANIGFYSTAEFDVEALPADVIAQAVEVGRACVAKEHRNTQVLFLLWRGLALYMATNRLRYLFGCCSLTSQDVVEGRAVMHYLAEHGHLHPELTIQPQADYVCYEGNPEPDPSFPVKIPQLFRIYLRHGAKVLGPPAIDRRFKTIDFLILFDVAAMDEKRIKTFFL